MQSTDYLARFNNSNLLQLQLRNYITLCELIRDNRAKLLNDRYCSSVAYCQLYVIVALFFSFNYQISFCFTLTFSFLFWQHFRFPFDIFVC